MSDGVSGPAGTPASAAGSPLTGGCGCRQVRYRLATPPLVVHCCHCRWCQRESGAAFALNAMIESDRLVVEAGSAEIVDTPSESGKGQQVARCPRCRLALWSHYAGSGPVTSFVRVGTLDDPDRLPPDLHIFTASKQPWVVLPPQARSFAGYYDRDAHWSADALARREALLPAVAVWHAAARPEWEARLAAVWQTLDDDSDGDVFVAAIEAAVADVAMGHPAGDPAARAIADFERACAHDSTGRPERAVPLYRAALATGLVGLRQRRAVIQLASSLRNLGQAEEGLALLDVEQHAGHDTLDDALQAVRALVLADLGHDRHAAAILLKALARHLPRYNRSMARYADALNPDLHTAPR